MENYYVKELVERIKQFLFGANPVDEVWENPRACHLGQKHFKEVRERCKEVGIRLEYIEYPMLDDDHHWYFIREGEDDPTGWLKYRREIP